MSEINPIETLTDSLQKSSIQDVGDDICKDSNNKLRFEEDEKPPSLKTGLVYDEKMAGYKCITPHPERPERVISIYKELLDRDLVNRCHIIKPRLATKEEIVLKHTEQHFDLIASLVGKDRVELEHLSDELNSIYFHPNISECALLSAGCTLELVEQVLKGNIKNGAAVVRPPGHHALEHESMGFCHFNNVALAAMMAIENYNLTRILIVDWDVHYGNATHQMFDEDPRVLYFSLHRYEKGQFWPNLKEADFNAVGKAKGEGFNMHVAWNKGKIKDSAYLYAFDNLLLPVMKDYDPEIVLVSAGFDSGEGDPLGGCNVTPLGYAQMTKRLLDFASGKVVVVLEGGYNLNTISKSMAFCVSTLLGDDVPIIPTTSQVDEPSNSALQSITDTYFTHLPYWENALGPLKSKFKDLKKFLLQNRTDLHTDNYNESSTSDEESPDFVKDPETLKWFSTVEDEA